MNWYDSVVKYTSDDLTQTKEGRLIISNFEGIKLKSYEDSVGVWTIGLGHTKGVTGGMTITKDQALAFFQSDIREFEQWVNVLVKAPLTQYQFDALVSFTFNLGPTNLKTSTLLEKVNEKDYEGAAEEFEEWVYAGGEDCRIKENNCYGIVKRRTAEKLMFQGKNWKEYVNEY